MRPGRIQNHTAELPAPPDWDAEVNGHCGTLAVRGERLNGVHYMRSAWEFEDSEAFLLLAGARLILGVAGHCHPVVHMEVAQLPADFQPVLSARRFSTISGQEAVHVEMLFSHDGGRRGMVDVKADGRTFAEAVALGVGEIEALARREGWVQV